MSVGSGLYKGCPNCGNSKSGTTILRCNSSICHALFCEVCVEDGGFHFGDMCPVCNNQLTPFHSNHAKEMGKIE